MRRTPGNQKGFTLLEMLVALTITAVGLLAVVTMQVIALNANSVANRISVTSFLAQQVAEEISSRNISDPLLNANTPGWVTYQFVDWSTGAQQLVSSLTITGAGNVTATYNIQANTFNGVPFAGMTEIQVTVNYKTFTTTYTTHKMVL